MTARSRLRFAHLATASAVIAALWASTACNGLLGNEERDADAGLTDVAPSEDASSSCPLGQHYCSAINSCGPSDDPAFGCGDPSCEPCAIANGKATCGGNGCVIDTCDAGFEVCNGACTDISTSPNCGSCGEICPGGQFCAPTLQSAPAKPYACVASCPAGLTECGTQCVDTTSTAAHCGSCTTPCPKATNGTYSCSNSKCQLDCDATYRTCPADSTVCVREDVQHCGPDCVACPASPIGTEQCSLIAGTYSCQVTCPANTMEHKYDVCAGACVDVDSDPNNCGACGLHCGGNNTTCMCKLGICAGTCMPTP